ncbi:MAG: PfkB family carbohydrate kinase [Janthinobacterium lividum]
MGGVTIDRFYRLARPLDLETSNPAAGWRGFGGVARNVAHNLVRLGVRAGLVSRVGDDEGGREILAALDVAGIDRCGVDLVPGAATADYVAVLTPEGDLALGLAAMDIFDGLTPGVLARHGDLVADAAWIFADCNLPADTLLGLARRQLSGGYRVAIDAVSVAKAERLPERLDGIDLLFLNRDEAGALASRYGRGGATADDIASLLVGLGAKNVVLTLGAAGALAASAAGAFHVPGLPACVVDVTGAGDALIAAVIHARAGGADLADAVASGCAAAARAVETPSSTPV